jgi:3-oxoacyl-[acyl-carrier-protein] synthase II
MEIWLTGAGMITSIGDNRRDCFDAFCQGRTGLAPLQAFDHDRFNVCNAYEIKDRTEGEASFRDTTWLCRAIGEAVQDAGLTTDAGELYIMIGTGLRELRSLELFYADGIPMAPQQLHFSEAVRRQAAGCRGVYTLSNACAASNYALGLAEDMLRLGQAEVVIVSGCDSITESMFGLLDRVNPQKPSRLQVFDRDRKGVLMGEGAAAVVLESSPHAQARGGKPLARLLSVGLSCDAHHETAPDHAGICRAMRDAHVRAGVAPKDVGVIFVHGTGTSLNDTTEGAALAEVFPESAQRFVLSGIKSMIGHTSGASGLVGVITAAMALNEKCVPPTVGLENPIDEVVGMRIATNLVAVPQLCCAQINAFGFGGVNSVVMLGGV